MTKPTATIGIPAYNEEHCIGSLLSGLRSQETRGFVIKDIYVLSDGSNDRTDEIVRGFEGVKLIADGMRMGKPARINQLFALAKSDFVVVLDADIRLVTPQVIQKMIDPMLADSKIALTSGNASPEEPDNLTGKILHTGIEIWDEARRKSNSDMYYCEGSARAFRKSLYQQMTFPPFSADDVYPYLYIAERGLKFSYAEDARVKYRLPNTYKDYVKQSLRFLSSPKIQETSFGKDIVAKHFTIDFRIKFMAVMKNFAHHPIFTAMYLIYAFWPKLLHRLTFTDSRPVWEIIQSTKL